MISLESIIKDASDFIFKEFRLAVTDTSLRPYDEDDWKTFCDVNGFEKNSHGLYVPKYLSAYVLTNSPNLISNAFHEYFGHGLFCEKSLIGKTLVDLTRKNEDTKSYLYDQIDRARQPFGICNQNIANYEGFAVWMEELLCCETNNEKHWTKRKETLPKNYIALQEHFKDFEREISRFGLMSQMGFPKEYDSEKVIDAVKKIYSEKFNNIDFVIAYGSKKPYSDIDLFIVSNNESRNYFYGWLDIYELNRNEFKYLLDNLDISVTDPLFNGELIYGDKNHFEELRKYTLNLPITKEAINHNLRRSEMLIENLTRFESYPREKNSSERYIESYRSNAEGLINNRKYLTLKNIIEYKKQN